MATNILHITDLHISNPNDIAENLRLLKYKEYIDDWHKSFSASIGTSKIEIDYLFVTGDFVDKGEVKNFGHAHDIINYIALTFSVSKNNVFICIGNHDIIRDWEIKGHPDKAISDYVDFEKSYNPPAKLVEAYGRARLYKSDNDYIIIFDAVSNTNGSDQPAKDLTDEFIDYIGGNWIKEKIPSDANLFILSHYPLVQSKRAQLDYEEPGWTGRHLWTAGYPIKERILHIREDLKGKTIWFFGDAHIPDLFQDKPNSSVSYMMTGQFGGNYTNPVYRGKAYNLYHQAAFLTVDDKEIKRILFSYIPSGFSYDAHIGTWDPVVASIEINSPPVALATTTTTTTTTASPIIQIKEPDFIVPVGFSIEQSIYEEIKNEKLFKFGKFVTSQENVALGWVSINKLFSNTILLSNGIDKIIEWLGKTILLDANTELFIGCGFWGGILAANVSVRTAPLSFTVSSFIGDKKNICPFEETLDCLIEKLSVLDKIKRIVVFADVVASGNTLLLIKDKVESTLKREYEWLAITVLVDEENVTKEFKNNFKICGALCTKLKMPIVKSNSLPDEEIFPAQLNFTVD